MWCSEVVSRFDSFLKLTTVGDILCISDFRVMCLWCEGVGVMYFSVIPVVCLEKKIHEIAQNTNCWSHFSPTAVVNTVSHSQAETCAPLGGIKPKGKQISFFFFFYSQIYNCYSGPCVSWHHSVVTSLRWTLNSGNPKLIAVLPPNAFSHGLKLQEVAHWNCAGSCLSYVVWPFLEFMSLGDIKH